MALSKSSVVQANAVSYSNMAEKLHENIRDEKGGFVITIWLSHKHLRK